MDALGDHPSGFDGSSFLSVLKGESDKHREYAYFMHNNFLEGPSYPIRSITNGDFHYIHNLNHHHMYVEKHLMGRPEKTGYWSSWVFNVKKSTENFNVVSNYMLRPEDELYHTKEDKFERKNLAGQKKYKAIQKQLSKELQQWMNKVGDPGAVIDTKEEFNAQKQGKHF